jgi:hypothetical protein
VKEGDALTQDYITQGQIDAKKQIVIGGTRLAALMVAVYGSSAQEASKFL